MSKHYVQYISGIDRQPVAKPINVSIERDGLKVFKQLIRWEDMTGVTTSTSAAGNKFSVGGAIMGDMLAGGIGALAGGMGGGSKFDTFVHITYTAGGQARDPVLLPKGAPKVKIKFINALTDKHGKAPEPALSIRESFQAINAKGKADRDAIEAKNKQRLQERREQLGLTPEAIAARKQRKQEHKEHRNERLKSLFGLRKK